MGVRGSTGTPDRAHTPTDVERLQECDLRQEQLEEVSSAAEMLTSTFSHNLSLSLLPVQWLRGQAEILNMCDIKGVCGGGQPLVEVWGYGCVCVCVCVDSL